MRATDAPGTNVSWVIRRFSSIVQRRRVLTSSNACFEVSTYPSWTLTLVSTKGIFLAYRHFVETVINGRLRLDAVFALSTFLPLKDLYDCRRTDAAHESEG